MGFRSGWKRMVDKFFEGILNGGFPKDFGLHEWKRGDIGSWTRRWRRSFFRGLMW